MTKDELVALAKSTALAYGMDQALVCGVIDRESSWDENVKPRFEPRFKAEYIDKLNLPEPEAQYRSTSWGPMQLMGECAREMGYEGALPDLQIPVKGINWGCKWLKKKLEEAGGFTERGLLYYNGGGNPNYGMEVMALAEKYDESLYKGEST
jgi:soluble lytic murein transglycosylase-like protein